ncbi:MAG: efflux RND transporter periplasmic adaptor subunit [Syntrophaceae bacterium]
MKKLNLNRKKIVLLVIVLLVLGVGALVWFGQMKSKSREIYYSGTIEAVQSELAFQVSGRVTAVNVREGDRVRKDQVLAALDPSEYKARLEQARANLERAVQNRSLAESNLSISRKTLPADVTRAGASLQGARDTLDKTERNKKRYDQLYERQVVSAREYDSVRLEYETARARYDEARAALSQARSNLKKEESLRKEVDAAAAQIKSLQSAVDQAELQLAYTELKAPYAGVILSRNIEPGEVVSPGRQAITMADLSSVDLKIFVAETEIGKVKPGGPVDVKVDTFPDRTFKGHVTFISPEGEFTPKVIQTQKERVKIVYLVKVSIPNPDLELKTGMPADAWLR